MTTPVHVTPEGHVDDVIERWRQIPGYEDRYDVSDHGRFRSWIYSGKTGIPRPMTPTRGDDDYSRISLWLDGKRTFLKIHVWVALAFHGPRPDGHEVRHRDGNRQNNRADNLAYGTPSENEMDKREHGTHHNGKKTHCPRGHEYDLFRTSSAGHARRECSTCISERQCRQRAERAASRKTVAV